MITNNSLTIYHLTKDDVTRLEKWVRFNYSKVWCFDSQVAKVGQGYDDANSVQIRIPYNLNSNLDVKNFAKGDIIVKGTLNADIQTQQDLEGYEIYNIKSINNNKFGNNPHIHLGGI